MAPFTPSLSNRIAQSLKDNPYYFQNAAPVQPSQQTQKGLRWGFRQLDQALGSAQGIPAMPAFGGQTITPGFNTQNLFARPGAAPGPADDRAYAAEKERARQLTEQDPLFKKYQVAELSKQYNAAKGDEREKIGMQIWAQTNPQLAAKMKPGQTGYSDVATAFQNLSPITGIIGKMPASSFAMPAASAMPGIEQTYGANAPQVAIAGFDPATAGSAVAPGAINTQLAANVTDYLTNPVKANAKFADLDQTQLSLLRQAFNQRIK